MSGKAGGVYNLLAVRMGSSEDVDAGLVRALGLAFQCCAFLIQVQTVLLTVLELLSISYWQSALAVSRGLSMYSQPKQISGTTSSYVEGGNTPCPAFC